LIDFFYHVFGRFVTRGVQKHDNFFFQKNPSGLITKNAAFFSSVFFFNPRLFCSIFFYRVFGRFATRGVQKRDTKKIAEISPQPPKKVPTYLRHFSPLFFHGPPCAFWFWDLGLGSPAPSLLSPPSNKDLLAGWPLATCEGGGP
jgi:hypothetical protein